MESPATVELWRAIYAQAEVWAQTPTVRQMAEQLPRNILPERRKWRGGALPSLLQELSAGFGGAMHPLMLGTRIPALVSQHPSRMTAFDERGLAEWLRFALAVESAHRVTLAWFRSRLPGYPLVRAPQLARNSPFTTREFTNRFIWTEQELGVGLQFESAAPRVAELLGASGHAVRQLDQAARDVCRELMKTASWTSLVEAEQALDPAAKSSLSNAKRELAGRLKPDAVNNHEPDRMLDRSQYRSHETVEAIARLTGPARRYADAFAAVEDLIKLAITDVFGELTLYGDPGSIDVFNVEFGGDGEPLVQFEVDDAASIFLSIEQVVWPNSAIVRDAVRIEMQTVSFSQLAGTQRYQARILTNSASAWPRDRS